MGVSLRRRRSGRRDQQPAAAGDRAYESSTPQQSSVPSSQEHGPSTGTGSSRSSRNTRGRSLTRSVSARFSRSVSRSRGSDGGGGPRRSRSPGRRRSFSLRRGRSRSRRSSSNHATDGDGGDDDDVNGDVRVMSSIGLTDMIDDDFLFEDSLHYDPTKHGLRADGTWGCDPATACGRPDSDGRGNGGEGGGGATLGVMVAKCFKDTEDACASFCDGMALCGPPSQDKRSGRNRSNRRGRCYGGEGTDGNSTLASFSSLESKTLASNTMPLKKKESKLAAYLRRSKSPAKNRKQSKTKDGGSRRRRSLSRGRSQSDHGDGDRGKGSAAAACFNPYGDDEVLTTKKTLSARRSKSKERKTAKWKLSKGKKKGGGKDSVKSPQSVADVSDWRSVRDDVLSHCDQGQFITYEAGRVRSSTKKRGDGGDSDTVGRFLYL